MTTKDQVRAFSAILACLLAALAILSFLTTPSASAQEEPLQEDPLQVSEISVGLVNTCALQLDGTPICWGGIGFGSIDQETPPPDGLTLTQIATGSGEACGIQLDQSVICWGKGFMAPSSLRADDLSLGRFDLGRNASTYACALQTDGTPFCWGSNDGASATPPADVQLTQISAASGYGCGVQTDATPICWGFEAPPEGLSVTQVSVGFRIACAIQTDGTPTCWGASASATAPAGITVSQISTGFGYACAVTTDGELVCWGANIYGAARPPAGVMVSQVSVGEYHACAVQTDGTPICWGSDEYGQSFIPGPLVQAVAVDDNFTGSVGVPTSFDICANDILGNGPARPGRISGGYGPGLSRDGYDYSCDIEGTPTTPGTFEYRYILGYDLDAAPRIATVTITIADDGPDIAPVANDDTITGTVGRFVSFDICANDIAGNGPIEPRRVSGWYGPGLTRTSWCTISGTPARAGTYAYTYRVTDNDGDTDDAMVTVTITN